MNTPQKYTVLNTTLCIVLHTALYTVLFTELNNKLYPGVQVAALVHFVHEEHPQYTVLYSIQYIVEFSVRCY